MSTLAHGGEAPTALHVFPADVKLAGARDTQSIVVQAEYANGVTRDVTDKADWKLSSEDIVSRQGNRLLPKSDGAVKLTVSFESLAVELPVEVAQAAVDPPVSFNWT